MPDGKVAIGMRYFLRSAGIEVINPARINCDNESVVKSSSLMKSELKANHVIGAFNVVRSEIARGTISIGHVPTAENLADIGTKALPAPQFAYLLGKMMRD